MFSILCKLSYKNYMIVPRERKVKSWSYIQKIQQFGLNIIPDKSTSFKNNAKEYSENEMDIYLAKEGIVHQSSYVDTPHQNGVTKKKNRHLLKVAPSLMFTTEVPKFF